MHLEPSKETLDFLEDNCECVVARNNILCRLYIQYQISLSEEDLGR